MSHIILYVVNNDGYILRQPMSEKTTTTGFVKRKYFIIIIFCSFCLQFLRNRLRMCKTKVLLWWAGGFTVVNRVNSYEYCSFFPLSLSIVCELPDDFNVRALNTTHCTPSLIMTERGGLTLRRLWP